MNTNITGHTRLTALFATPIRHSISPMIQNTAFQALAIDAVYLAFEIGTDQLEEALSSIRTLDMMGANLSMPNKIKAVGLMDELSEAARLIGAVNTIEHRDGKLIGHNTDGIGFMKSLAEMDVTIIGKKITIIGAGGAATAIIVQAALDGVKEIAVYNRRDDFYEKIKEKLASISTTTASTITVHDLEEEASLSKDVSESSLLLNATGVGMKPLELETPIKNFDIIHPNLAVCDVIYTPKETEFLKQARLRGATTKNGLGMLLYQGAAAFEIWTGKEMPIDSVKNRLNMD